MVYHSIKRQNGYAITDENGKTFPLVSDFISTYSYGSWVTMLFTILEKITNGMPPEEANTVPNSPYHRNLIIFNEIEVYLGKANTEFKLESSGQSEVLGTKELYEVLKEIVTPK
jgi:hypothetical protein